MHVHIDKHARSEVRVIAQDYLDSSIIENTEMQNQWVCGSEYRFIIRIELATSPGYENIDHR